MNGCSDLLLTNRRHEELSMIRRDRLVVGNRKIATMRNYKCKTVRYQYQDATGGTGLIFEVFLFMTMPWGIIVQP
jgi:hypothetical protein